MMETMNLALSCVFTTMMTAFQCKKYVLFRLLIHFMHATSSSECNTKDTIQSGVESRAQNLAEAQANKRTINVYTSKGMEQEIC